MQNFTPGISQGYYGNNIAPAQDNSQLLSMLHQLVQQHLGVTSAGTNNYKIPLGSLQDGFIDKTGRYTPGFPG